MKVTFEDIFWRFEEDETTIVEEFGVKHSRIGNLNSITYDFNTGECKIHGSENTFGCHVYSFKHTTTGLERTTLLFARLNGSIGEIIIFPNGKVAVIFESYINAPQWAVEKQKKYCI